jgi:phage shock protein A
MGIIDRLKFAIHSMVSTGNAQEIMLEPSVEAMYDDLLQLRQSIATKDSDKKRSEQQYYKVIQDEYSWLSKVDLALAKGDFELAEEAFYRKITYSEQAATLKIQIDRQLLIIEEMNNDLIKLKQTMYQVQNKRDLLHSISQSAKIQKKLPDQIAQISVLISRYKMDKTKSLEQSLERAVRDIQEDLVQLREAVFVGLSSHKRSENQCREAIQNTASAGIKFRAAMAQCDRTLAREFLIRKRICTDYAHELQVYIDSQVDQIELLRNGLRHWESKIIEIKCTFEGEFYRHRNP